VETALFLQQLEQQWLILLQFCVLDGSTQNSKGFNFTPYPVKKTKNFFEDNEYSDFSFLKARSASNVSSTISKVTSFDTPTNAKLSAGIYYIDILIMDVWGASTFYTIPSFVTVSKAQRSH